MLWAIQHGGIFIVPISIGTPCVVCLCVVFSSFSGIVHSYEFKEVTTTGEEVTYGMLDAYDH